MATGNSTASAPTHGYTDEQVQSLQRAIAVMREQLGLVDAIVSEALRLDPPPPRS